MTRNIHAYRQKLAAIEPHTLLPYLRDIDARFVRDLAERYRFTHQEVRQISQAARDLEMWREEGIAEWWSRHEGSLEPSSDPRNRKRALLGRLRSHLASLAAVDKVYLEDGMVRRPPRSLKLVETDSHRQLLGPCPAYSEHTVCCGLHTLDAVRGCAFSCSYCTIQTFYGQTAEIEVDLLDKLARIELDPGRRYHIGTGQASDSLLWGDRQGVLSALVRFAEDNPNVLLELKTKSDNVAALARMEIPPNVVCSWTLNTDPVIQYEEAATATLDRRLAAARTLADRGVAVAFHFHPMIRYRGSDHDYPDLAARVRGMFAASEISFISMGTVTLIKPVVQEIRRRGGHTRILQMEMVRDHHGKLTYPDAVKVDLFRSLYLAFSSWKRAVFFYLCMESASIWQQALGFSYSTNSEFEESFLERCLPRRPAPAVGSRRSSSRPSVHWLD